MNINELKVDYVYNYTRLDKPVKVVNIPVKHDKVEVSLDLVNKTNPFYIHPSYLELAPMYNFHKEIKEQGNSLLNFLTKEPVNPSDIMYDWSFKPEHEAPNLVKNSVSVIDMTVDQTSYNDGSVNIQFIPKESIENYKKFREGMDDQIMFGEPTNNKLKTFYLGHDLTGLRVELFLTDEQLSELADDWLNDAREQFEYYKEKRLDKTVVLKKRFNTGIAN